MSFGITVEDCNVLSKSQARVFFLGGTFLFTAIFLGLTVDSMKQIPEQTNEAALTQQAIEGKRLWEDNNCMGVSYAFR